MPRDADSRRWRYIAAAAVFVVMLLMVDAAFGDTVRKPSAKSSQWWFCDMQCSDGDSADSGMEFHVFAPAAAASAKDYISATALISKGYDSTVMGSYESGCPDQASEVSKAANLSAKTTVKAADVSAGIPVVQSFQPGPPPSRDTTASGDGGGDTPADAGGPPPTEKTPPAPIPRPKLAGKKDRYQCLRSPSPPLPMCPGTYDPKQAIAAWDGVMYFKGDQYIFVPCATNTAKGIKTYKQASGLAARNVVYFKGNHGGAGKVMYHLTHESDGPKR